MCIGAKEPQMCLKNLAKYRKYLGLFCRQLSQVRKMDFLGYESTSPIFDLDHGGQIFESGQEKKKVDHAQKSDFKNSGWRGSI